MGSGRIRNIGRLSELREKSTKLQTIETFKLDLVPAALQGLELAHMCITSCVELDPTSLFTVHHCFQVTRVLWTIRQKVMRIYLLSVLCALLSTTVAAQLQQVVITYPDVNTPQSVLDSAKERIQEAVRLCLGVPFESCLLALILFTQGEFITHEYRMLHPIKLPGHLLTMSRVGYRAYQVCYPT